MTQELNNQITGSTDTQSADRSLLEYLKPKSEDRFSKLEAYCDLLSRASSGAFVAANGERREELVPGQFVASISELARKWKWQRALLCGGSCGTRTTLVQAFREELHLHCQPSAASVSLCRFGRRRT